MTNKKILTNVLRHGSMNGIERHEYILFIFTICWHKQLHSVNRICVGTGVFCEISILLENLPCRHFHRTEPIWKFHLYFILWNLVHKRNSINKINDVLCEFTFKHGNLLIFVFLKNIILSLEVTHESVSDEFLSF